MFLCLLWYNNLNVSAVHMICVKLFSWLEYLIQDISYAILRFNIRFLFPLGPVFCNLENAQVLPAFSKSHPVFLPSPSFFNGLHEDPDVIHIPHPHPHLQLLPHHDICQPLIKDPHHNSGCCHCSSDSSWTPPSVV